MNNIRLKLKKKKRVLEVEIDRYAVLYGSMLTVQLKYFFDACNVTYELHIFLLLWGERYGGFHMGRDISTMLRPETLVRYKILAPLH